MIATGYYATRKDGVNLCRTYSTEGKKIVQNETGAVYDEAIDVEGSGYTYTETDEPIEVEDIDPAELGREYTETDTPIESEATA